MVLSLVVLFACFFVGIPALTFAVCQHAIFMVSNFDF